MRTISFLWLALIVSSAVAADRPNILWITSEDNGPQLGCYGDKYAVSPQIDALAAKSLRYKMCWSNAPVCAPARTTIISGMYATSLGGHHMRSGVKLPADIKLYPALMREAGYYCTNSSKTDYNFVGADASWNESSGKAHWRNRPDKETPFFAVFNYTVSHESKIRTRPHTLKHDPAKAPLPKYHPDTPEVRHDWAQYYDKLTEMDAQVGNTLKQLEADGLADSTIVFYYGDHGSGMPRSKRWPFNSGLQVPLIVHVPEKFKELAPRNYAAGGESTQLTAFVDLAPTILSLAGTKPPTNMQGVPFAGKYAGEPKKYLFGYRGRMDERIDMVRSCTDGRYVYMRHFYPDRPYLKHVEYMFATPTTRVWHELFLAGKLNETQAKVWKNKPVEELFDLESDPDETLNLASDPQHGDRVAEMRSVLKDWMIQTKDLGLLPEAEMHRRCGEIAPREYALSGKVPFEKLADLAFDGLGEQRLRDRDALSDADSGVRFWAVRALGFETQKLVEQLGKGHPKCKMSVRLLENATTDESPSVAIAACDALLKVGDATLAKQRLVELANVEKVGHFAAVAALNVLDMNAELDAETLAAMSELPRKVAKPPVRMGAYVGKLLNHALKTSEPPASPNKKRRERKRQK